MSTLSHSKTYQIRIDAKEKQETFAVFSDLGITPAQAIKMFFTQVRTTRSIPFPIEHKPNARTAKILLASDQSKNYKGFDNIEDLFRDLAN
ncbi:MAG: type II toxin-antitoxin system RelB/DinJ family antitoxin [Candidatus Gracilibacteria bacterium]|nr:type II toxin-antitoxin system RelB/DinJ family antitoxin [Candidatus Gracilibacteria bacterium]